MISASEDDRALIPAVSPFIGWVLASYEGVTGALLCPWCMTFGRRDPHRFPVIVPRRRCAHAATRQPDHESPGPVWQRGSVDARGDTRQGNTGGSRRKQTIHLVTPSLTLGLW